MQEECREFVRQLLRALSFCHASGLMLRDMKPRNVMIHSAARDPVTHRLTQPIALKVTGLALGRFASIPEEPLTREVVPICCRISVCLSVCLSIYLSIYLSMHFNIYKQIDRWTIYLNR